MNLLHEFFNSRSDAATPLSAEDQERMEAEFETFQQSFEILKQGDLASFGRYLLSESRTERIRSNYKEENISVEERLREVYQADVENWKNTIE